MNIARIPLKPIYARQTSRSLHRTEPACASRPNCTTGERLTPRPTPVAQLVHPPHVPHVVLAGIWEILTCDGGLERLVRLLRDFCSSPPPPKNPSAIYDLSPLGFLRTPP
ncbi:hypothetical protein DFH11DRAFT_1647118, partial [Phellopilus nigrolimitatus]